MPKDSNRGGSSRNDNWSDGVMDLARERPIAAAAVAAGAAAAGLFLWSKRNQISQQLSNLTDQIGEWTENMSSGSGFAANDDTAGLTTSGRTDNRSSSGSRAASGSRTGTRGRGSSASTTARGRGMSETGGGNASLGAHSGGAGTTTTGSPTGRGRATDNS